MPPPKPQRIAKFNGNPKTKPNPSALLNTIPLELISLKNIPSWSIGY
jgi:hypothetical protein